MKIWNLLEENSKKISENTKKFCDLKLHCKAQVSLSISHPKPSQLKILTALNQQSTSILIRLLLIQVLISSQQPLISKLFKSLIANNRVSNNFVNFVVHFTTFSRYIIFLIVILSSAVNQKSFWWKTHYANRSLNEFLRWSKRSNCT